MSSLYNAPSNPVLGKVGPNSQIQGGDLGHECGLLNCRPWSTIKKTVCKVRCTPEYIPEVKFMKTAESLPAGLTQVIAGPKGVFFLYS
jgi:hypothetical protein